MKGRALVWFLIRLALTVGLFVWLFRDGTLRAQMASLPAPTTPLWLGAALVLAGVLEAVSVLRFWICTRLAGIPTTLRRATALHFLGLFTSLFLPGVAGGDALKIALLAAQFPQRRFGGLVAVLMDRISGFIVLVVWLAGVALVREEWFAPVATILRSVLLITGPAAAGLVFWFLLSRTHWMRTRISRFPLRPYILRCEAGFDLFIADRPRAAATLLLSAFAFTAHFLIFACAGRAFGASVAPFDMLCAMPLVDVITMLPVTVAGLGLRESMFTAVIAPLCSITAAQALVMSLTGFLASVLWALLGAPVLLSPAAKHTPQNA